MSNLKNVRAELEKMKKEMAAEDDGMYGVNQFEEEDPYESGKMQ